MDCGAGGLHRKLEFELTRRGAALVKPLVVVTAIGMALRLLYEQYL